jgi:hypothetical protein
VKGFALGTIALIAAYLAVKPGAANAATQGGNIIVSALQRLLSPNVAGIPQRLRTGTAATPSSSTTSSTSGQITV